MFALAVPNELRAVAGIAVILRIMGKTYSSRCASSQSTTPSVCEVMLVTWMSPPSREENCCRVFSETVFSPVVSSSFSNDKIPWIAAPTATASSGFTSSTSGTAERLATISRTIGIRVMPPTSSTLSISLHSIRASWSTISQIVLHFSTRCRVFCSNSSRVSSTFTLLPLWL